jgi:hypothetical protein
MVPHLVNPGFTGIEAAVGYVDKNELLEEIIHAKKLGRVTHKLGKLIEEMVEGYSNHPWWVGFSNHWKDEMALEAKMALSRGILKFDPEKSREPFSYCTTIMYRAFRSVKEKEQKHGRVRDALDRDPYYRETLKNQEDDPESGGDES